MNRIHRAGRICRSAGILAWLACAALASIAAAPAAFASTSRRPSGSASAGPAPVNLHLPPGWNKHPPLPDPAPAHLPALPPGWNKHPPLPDPARVHAALASGMPGWQITFVAVGAAVLATAVAVLIARARAARQHVTVSAT
jgi:hypothetical protein